jgi:hypothetical protein
MVLENRDLLQVNATVIAGLLILLTIQSTTTFWDLYEDHMSIEQKIQELKKLANNTSDDFDLQKKINERIIELTIEDSEKFADTHLIDKTSIDPMIFFLVTMIPFIGSCIWEIHFGTKNPGTISSSQQGRIMTYIGFVMLFASTLALILVRFLL